MVSEIPRHDCKERSDWKSVSRTRSLYQLYYNEGGEGGWGSPPAAIMSVANISSGGDAPSTVAYICYVVVLSGSIVAEGGNGGADTTTERSEGVRSQARITNTFDIKSSFHTNI